MVNDQEPRYRLVDSNGNVVGSLFQNAAGNVEIQDETGTGSVFGADGIVTPAIDAGSASVGEATVGGTGPVREVGSVDHGSVSAESDSIVEVTFTNNYDTDPSVIHGFGLRDPIRIFENAGSAAVVAMSIDTTGFQSRIYNSDSSSRTIDRCAYLVIEI